MFYYFYILHLFLFCALGTIYSLTYLLTVAGFGEFDGPVWVSEQRSLCQLDCFGRDSFISIYTLNVFQRNAVTHDYLISSPST